MDTATVIALYRKNAIELGGANPFQLPTRPKDIASAERYLKWCGENEVDPEQFMRFRIEQLFNYTGHWPSLSRLPSDKVLKQYREYGEGEMLHKKMEQQIAAAAPKTASSDHIQSLRLVTPSQEAFRRHHLLTNTSWMCKTAPEHSSGYHPRSSVCPQCPEAVGCAIALNAREGFDVVALRADRLKDLPNVVLEALFARGT